MTVVDLPAAQPDVTGVTAAFDSLLVQEGWTHASALPVATLRKFPEALVSDLMCFIDEGQHIECGEGGTVVWLDEILPGLAEGELILVGTVIRVARFPQFPMIDPGDEIRFRTAKPLQLCFATVRTPCNMCEKDEHCVERERRADCKPTCEACAANKKCRARERRWKSARCQPHFEAAPVTLADMKIDTDVIKLRLLR